MGRSLAEALGYRFLDTGILYRALTWLALDRGIDVEDEEALGRLAQESVIRVKGHDEGTVYINEHQVSEELRRPEVDRRVSLVARVPEVRAALVEQQREIAGEGRIVVVGRDIGTVVLPDAEVKLFLVASARQRAERRYAELAGRGHTVEFDQVLEDLAARDELDTERTHAPLRPAPDAIVLDTDGLDVRGVVAKVLALIGEH